MFPIKLHCCMQGKNFCLFFAFGLLVNVKVHRLLNVELDLKTGLVI